MADEGSSDPNEGHVGRLSAQEASALVEQYKLYVEQTAVITAQRGEANRFFVTVNAVLLAAYGFVWDVDRIAETVLLPVLMCSAALAGVVACWRWRARIRGYKKLLHKRFDIVMAMEDRLPSRPYRDESALFQPSEGRRKLAFSTSELQPTWGFSVFHSGVLVLVLALVWAKINEREPPIALCGWFNAAGDLAADPCVPLERRLELSR